MVVVEAPQVRLVVMDLAQASTALSRMAAVAVGHNKLVAVLVLRVVALVKIQVLRLVHLHKDLPEQQDQVQLLQLAPVAVAVQVQLEYVDSFIQNFQVLNELQVATAAMDFHIQFPELLRITAVVVAAVQITTPAQLSNLGVAETVAVVMVPMQI
jgi:hypothetical protein